MARGVGGGPHYYDVFGLRVASALPLKGLVDAIPGTPDVMIELGEVPAIPDAPQGYHTVSDGTLLTIDEIARYWISEGRRIVVAPAADASARDVLLFLLGSAMGAVLHQRGLVPLHANAVEIDGRAVAFMGHSGAGKSTLATWFLDRGDGVLTDDVCVIDPATPGRPIAYRGLVRLRLTSEALTRSGRPIVEDDRSMDGQDKFDVAMPDGRLAPGRLPMGAAVLLERADDEVFAIRRLRGADAVSALFENIYRGAYAGLSGRSAELLAACAELARRIPVLAVRRRWDLEHFDGEAERIAAAIADILRETTTETTKQ